MTQRLTHKSILTWENTPYSFLHFTRFFLNFVQKRNYSIILEEFGQLCAIFQKFAMKISGEIICQSWLLLTPFFNLTIVHCMTWFKQFEGFKCVLFNNDDHCFQHFSQGGKIFQVWQRQISIQFTSLKYEIQHCHAKNMKTSLSTI